MNTSLVKAAVPFAVLFDGLLLVKIFGGYSDPTMTVLMVVSFVITVLLALRATGHLAFPTFSGWFTRQPEVQHIHHHHYESDSEDEDEDEDEDNSEDEDCEDDCECDEEYPTAEDLRDKYDEGHSDGYDAGYQARKEEQEEADTLAKAVVSEVNKNNEVAPAIATDVPVPSAEAPSENR
jgi:hypothetical protein